MQRVAKLMLIFGLIGYLGYNTYLHVFENGQEIEKRKIATTWYSKSS